MNWTDMYAKAILADDGEAIANFEEQLHEASYIMACETVGPNSPEFEGLRERWEMQHMNAAHAAVERMRRENLIDFIIDDALQDMQFARYAGLVRSAYQCERDDLAARLWARLIRESSRHFRRSYH